MPDLYKFRIWCDTDSQYEYGWYEADPGVCPVNNTHTIDDTKTTIVDRQGDGVRSLAKKTNDGIDLVVSGKSFAENNKAFVTLDYSNKQTWWYDSTDVVDEVASANGTYDQYICANLPFINLYKITDRADITGKTVVVKKNDVTQTSGFTINYALGRIDFSSPLDPGDVVKVSYSYPNSSLYEIKAATGKKLKVSYVESQFSANTLISDIVAFDVWIKNPNTGDTEVILQSAEYHSAADFLNKGNGGHIMEPFGELTKKVNIFPWNYLSGFTLKPEGDATTNPYQNEFNGVRVYLKNNIPLADSEIATATFYCFVENL